MQQADLFNPKIPIWQKFLPIIDSVDVEGINVSTWDIPYTITALAYLTHSHFRYYGKFPSAVAGAIIENYYPKNTNRPIFDNFCGSGTSLVEGALRGIASYGVDVSWLSVMASNVKTEHIEIDRVGQILARIRANYSPDFDFEPSAKQDKWFDRAAIAGLRSIQNQLFEQPFSAELRFLVCAFLAIVRRTSRAFDAEVRPHINPNKKLRDPIKAYVKKVSEMLRDHKDYQKYTQSSLQHRCLLGKAEEASKVYDGDSPALIISHPPYLNAFNYRPVFSLEYMWGEPFEGQFVNQLGYYKNEIVAHPASENIVSQYFNLLKLAYSDSFAMQKPGDVLSIVIGDCTRNKKLIPVISKVTEIVSEIGYTPIALNYRTTHYGAGKYAYENRADYHKDSNAKKDGIIVFRK